MMKEDEVKEQLMSADPKFRRLADEHRQHEGRLAEINSRHRVTAEDQAEAARLKKRKLQLKDQMTSMIQKFRGEPSHQHT